MNTMNNFTISGFVVKDAEVKNFEKSSIARFGLSFKTSEKNGNTEVKSAIVNIETWIKNDDAATQELLKKGSLIKIGGFFKADPYTKDGKSVNQYRLVATKIEQVQKKAQ
jgi:single-strand DNA-binding protein